MSKSFTQNYSLEMHNFIMSLQLKDDDKKRLLSILESADYLRRKLDRIQKAHEKLRDAE